MDDYYRNEGEDGPNNFGQERGSNYRKQKEAYLRTNFDEELNWNYLFMN